ncbi:nucleotidyltransferase domain-containing protein [Peribacillus aracenensis]|uniref:nucleotidyltransferase domain-containing protein n=1 Tax=Peribacillus aracenensis TaxID=2976708 RepID=UPI0021A51069|nr:nucleotidyltransferase family protein [Peribacillus sp. BBB004]
MYNNYILDLSSLPKELRLLLEIMKTDEHNIIGSVKKELYVDIDWEVFLQLARHHRVYPLVYSKLKNTHDNQIPPHVIQTLYKEYKKNTFQMLHLSGEMEQVSEIFNKNSIRILFLKGPIIAQELYGDISLRTSKDIDILISMTDIKKAEKILLNCGYEKEESPNILNEWKWRTHHISYYHSQKQIQIEIHWRLNPFPSKEPSFEKLWERKRTSNLTTYPVYLLGEEDLFLYLITHGARHGWFRLRWLIDIDQMVLKGLREKQIISSLKKYKYHRIVGQALILTSQLLNTPVNSELKKLTIDNYSEKLAQKSILFISEKSQFEYPKDYMDLLKTNWQKFISLIMRIYPRYIDANTLKLPLPLHFLYFPLRPFLWVWRKTRKST